MDNSEPLNDAEQQQLIELVRRATGVRVRRPCQNEPSGWVTELHVATAGPYSQLCNPAGKPKRGLFGPDWSNVKTFS